jgi:hypothetical protein
MTLHTPFMHAQTQRTQIVESTSGRYEDDAFTTLDESYSGIWWTITISFLLSFYWTNQVLGNVVQATVAGAVGTWWFDPEETHGCCCCSPALTGSLFRSVTYSFGSICFGSLIVAVIQTLRALVDNAAQNNRDRGGDGCGGALLICLVQCLLQLLEQAAEYFNKWAFIYVGLYGYSYLEAGQNVLTLFRERGWSAVISDNLTARVLGMMGFAIGLGTALMAALIAGLVMSVSSHYDQGGLIIAGSVVLALIIGMVLASIIFGVVNSGVDTIVVLFAEAPKEFQENHPQLSKEMNEAWRDAWPEMFIPSEPTTAVV